MLTLAAQLKALLHKPTTRVKLRADTYIRFNGTDHVTLQSAFCDTALQIKYDILLVIYELVEWKTLGELLAPWPLEDQGKIVNYMEQFFQAQFLLIEGFNDQSEGTQTDLNQPVTEAYNKVPINIDNHLNMLKDHVRMTAYRRAIERAVHPETVALDLGAGTGVLSFFASQAGAKQVFAIERRPHVVQLAKALATANGLQNVAFIEALSTQLTPTQLGQEASDRPNLLIAEIIGDGILEENIIEYTLDARDRLLAPGAKLLPYQLDLYGFAFDTEIPPNQSQHEIAELKALYNLDFDLLGQVIEGKPRLRRERYHTQLQQAKSTPQLLHSLNFYTLQEKTFSVPVALTITEGQRVSGVCCYFKAHLDEATTLSNSPWGPQTHWVQLLYYFAQPRLVAPGDVVKLNLVYDGSLRFELAEEA